MADAAANRDLLPPEGARTLTTVRVARRSARERMAAVLEVGIDGRGELDIYVGQRVPGAQPVLLSFGNLLDAPLLPLVAAAELRDLLDAVVAEAEKLRERVP